MKYNSIFIIGIPDREEREQGIDNLFKEIMTKTSLTVEEKDIQVQEVRRTPNNMEPKKLTPRHILIKIAKVKDKERILKAALA